MPPRGKTKHEVNGADLSGAPRPPGLRTPPTGSTPNKVDQSADLAPGEMAQDPNLVARIQADIADMGVVGEEDNSFLIYLTATSRKRRHPLRLIIQGPSGAGKSHPPQRVASLMPPGEVIEATSLTPQALYYGEPGWLEHKLLFKGERSHRTDEEAADQTAALRQLISEDRIVKQVTVNDAGVLTTRSIEQNGPIAFIETTTCKSLFAEDENRCLKISPDDSSAQTKRILLASAERYECGTAPDSQAIIDRHRAFQDSLQKDLDVVIPFASQLAEHLPASKLESRRAMKQLLATIETITFLHQHQRDPNSDGRLVATEADYQLARRLLLPALTESLGVGARAWNAYRALKEKIKGPLFDSTQTLNAGVFNNKATRDRALKDLEELEVLRCVQPGKGRSPARWAWTRNALKPLLPETLS